MSLFEGSLPLEGPIFLESWLWEEGNQHGKYLDSCRLEASYFYESEQIYFPWKLSNPFIEDSEYVGMAQNLG